MSDSCTCGQPPHPNLPREEAKVLRNPEQLTNSNGTSSESAPKVTAETVTGESRQPGGNPVGATTLTPEVLEELKRLDHCDSAFDHTETIADYHSRVTSLRRLLYENSTILIAAAERDMERRTRIGTHSDRCFRWHHECAIGLVERHEKRIAELEAALNAALKESLTGRSECFCCEDAAESLEKALKGDAK